MGIMILALKVAGGVLSIALPIASQLVDRFWQKDSMSKI